MASPGSDDPMTEPRMQGGFFDEDGERWYRIVGPDAQAPFFTMLASDSDLWAFVSTAGSLTAGRHDPDGAFFPYETVDKLHRRWEHTGPRSWILVEEPAGPVLWEPFAPKWDGTAGHRQPTGDDPVQNIDIYIATGHNGYDLLPGETFPVLENCRQRGCPGSFDDDFFDLQQQQHGVGNFILVHRDHLVHVTPGDVVIQCSYLLNGNAIG